MIRNENWFEIVSKSKVKQKPIVLGQAVRLSLISGFEAQLKHFKVKLKEILPNKVAAGIPPGVLPSLQGQGAGPDPASLGGVGSPELPLVPVVAGYTRIHRGSSTHNPGLWERPPAWGRAAAAASHPTSVPSPRAGRHPSSQQKNLLAAPSLFSPLKANIFITARSCLNK